MAALSKRLLTLGVAVTFLIGITAQLLPFSMAEPQTTVSAEMGGGSPGPHPPCSGQMPDCFDHGGCISVSVLPTWPATVAVPVEWTPLVYSLAPQALSGISVKPELSPPIFAA